MIEWFPSGTLPETETELMVCRKDGSLGFATLVPEHMLRRLHAQGEYGQVWLMRGCMVDDVTHWAHVNPPGGITFPEFPVMVLFEVARKLYPEVEAEVRFGDHNTPRQGVLWQDEHILVVNPFLPVVALLDVLCQLLAKLIAGDGDPAGPLEQLRTGYDQAIEGRHPNLPDHAFVSVEVALQIGEINLNVEMGFAETQQQNM